MSRLHPVHAVLFAVLTASTAVARAQPVSFQMKNDVPAGQKPTMTLMAVDKVLDVKLELARDDGEKFVQIVPALEAGRSAVLSIGDGKPGKAHYSGKLAMNVVGQGPWSYNVAFDTLVRGAMTLSYDSEHLDLANRVLRFQQSRPAGRADVVVIDEERRQIGAGVATYNREPPGTWLPITWTQSAPGRVMLIRLRAVAADGLSASVDLVPWAVTVEHEDVNFDTDSAVIKASEASKLDASLRKINDLVKHAERFLKVKLYVAGHTDTVGGKDHNRKLSHERARAIARYFHNKGLAIPIAYDGFGEEVPKVPTPDNTDEPRNRRADYVLGGASAAPPFSGAYSAVRADWQLIK